MDDNLEYESQYSGPQIDEAVGRAISGGKIDGILAKKVEMSQVWLSASPSSEFPEQRISVDLSGCEFAAITVAQYGSVPANRRTFIVQLNTYSPLYFPSGTYSPQSGEMYGHNRLVYADAEGCTFNAGLVIADNGVWTEDNASSIPVSIYGIKGVIG